MVAIGGNVVQIIIKATDQASAVIDGVKQKTGGLGAAMDKLRGPMLAVGAASVGMAAISVKSFADYETSMAKVNTLLDEGENATELYGDSVARLAEEYGVAGGRMGVAAGLYQTISAGITDTAEATQFLEAATKAAVGGSAELDTVILAGTKTMAAFGLSAEDTEMVMDKFAGTVKAGQTTMSELAGAFPRVSGMAGEMGVSLDETLGTLAGLTKIMGSTEEAATGMSAIFTGLLKPTDTMKETLAGLGFESGQAAIESLGLMGTLQALKEASGDDAEAMGELFGNVQALRSVFPALGTAAEDVAASIDIVSNSAGLSTKQFEDMDKTAGQRMAKLQAKFEGMTVRIGEALMPLLEKMVPIVEQVIEIFAGLDPVIQAGVLVLGALAGAFALLWPVISGIAGAIGGAGGLTAVIAALTGPIGWVIAAVGLLAAAWATNFGGIRDIVDSVIKKVAPIFEKIMNLLGHIVEILVDRLGPIAEEIFAGVSVAIELAWGFIEPIFNKICEAVGLVIDTFDALLSALEGDLGPLENVLNKWLGFFIGIFDDVIAGAGTFVVDIFNKIKRGIEDVGSWLYTAGRDLIWSIIDGLQSIGWRIWDTIMGFIPSVSDITDAIWGVVNTASNTLQGTGDYLVGSVTGTGGIWGDFIARPGQPIQYFSPTDTVIGVKDTSVLAPATGPRTINVYMTGVTFASDYDVDAFKRRLADAEEEAWASRQNR